MIGSDIPRYLSGEEDAIKRVVNAGDIYGYGNMIYHLQRAWSKHIQDGGVDIQTADTAAGIICVWCHVDSRNGRKIKSNGGTK
jgi:hypothetical protein